MFTLTTVIVMMNMMTKIRIVNMTRIRLIVSSTDISEEAELRLTSMLNETIKNYWVALGTDEKEDEWAYYHYFRAPELRKEYRVEARGRPLGGQQMMIIIHKWIVMTVMVVMTRRENVKR